MMVSRLRGLTYDADENSCCNCNLGVRPKLPPICVRQMKKDVDVDGAIEEKERYFVYSRRSRVDGEVM
jgi:hypothetical protein